MDENTKIADLTVAEFKVLFRECAGEKHIKDFGYEKFLQGKYHGKRQWSVGQLWPCDKKP